MQLREFGEWRKEWRHDEESQDSGTEKSVRYKHPGAHVTGSPALRWSHRNRGQNQVARGTEEFDQHPRSQRENTSFVWAKKTKTAWCFALPFTFFAEKDLKANRPIGLEEIFGTSILMTYYYVCFSLNLLMPTSILSWQLPATAGHCDIWELVMDVKCLLFNLSPCPLIWSSAKLMKNWCTFPAFKPLIYLQIVVMPPSAGFSLDQATPHPWTFPRRSTCHPLPHLFVLLVSSYHFFNRGNKQAETCVSQRSSDDGGPRKGGIPEAFLLHFQCLRIILAFSHTTTTFLRNVHLVNKVCSTQVILPLNLYLVITSITATVIAVSNFIAPC